MTDATLESAARAGAFAKRRLRVLSGMQPTGRMHFGYYLGALRSWVRLQDDHECVFFVADYHSLTTVTDPLDAPAGDLRAGARLACGRRRPGAVDGLPPVGCA